MGSKLSPTGKHLVTLAPQTGNVVVREVRTREDVTPTDDRYPIGLAPSQRIDNDTFYAAGTPRNGGLLDVVRCTVSTDRCRVVAKAVGVTGEVQLPSGQNDPLE